MNMILVVVCLIVGFNCAKSDIEKCPCPNVQDCDHPTLKDTGIKGEVYVFTNFSTDVHLWKWETITTLVVPSHFSIKDIFQARAMCIAHNNGRKLGVTIDFTLKDPVDETSDEAKEWLASAVSNQQNWRAEVVVVNLVPYFSSDTYSQKEDHISVIKLVANMKKKILNQTDVSVQVSCIVPWIPPCAENEASCIFAKLSSETCDYFIISPESFNDLSNVKCRARATIPFSKLLYGISEYSAHSIPASRIILGIAWHGYDFPCVNYDSDICSLEEKISENSTIVKCHVDKKQAVSNGDIYSRFLEQSKNSKSSDFYNAPYFTYKEGEVVHEVWFENYESLSSKYQLVHEMGLQGIGIMYGDDLLAYSEFNILINDEFMWSWVSHEFLLTTSKNPITPDLHHADTVAGIAVGCLILGTFLGIVFTCIGLRSRVKKPKPPFFRDGDTDEEFMSEDPNL